MIVLVADDSAIMRSVLTRVLRLTGLPLSEVLQAGDGETALRMLQQHPVDLALLDINMPVLSGVEVLRRLRAVPALAGLPVLVVSSDGSDARLECVQQMGAAFVHKPFTPEVLHDEILQLKGSAHDTAAR